MVHATWLQHVSFLPKFPLVLCLLHTPVSLNLGDVHGVMGTGIRHIPLAVSSGCSRWVLGHWMRTGCLENFLHHLAVFYQRKCYEEWLSEPAGEAAGTAVCQMFLGLERHEREAAQRESAPDAKWYSF